MLPHTQGYKAVECTSEFCVKSKFKASSQVLKNIKQHIFLPETCKTITCMPNSVFSCWSTFKSVNFMETGIKMSICPQYPVDNYSIRTVPTTADVTLQLPGCSVLGDEHRFRIKFCGFSALWWIWIRVGYYKFCLTGFGLDLKILFWISSKLSVLFRNCWLLHLIWNFTSVEFLTTVEIVYQVCWNLEHWQNPVMQSVSLPSYVSCHQAKS